MNEQTTKLIEQLAHKLGTTSEYLWGVLLKQAPLSAITDLMYLVIVVIMGIGLYKLHKRFSKETTKYDVWSYESNGELVIPIIIILAIIWVILLIICFCSIDNIIYGFFNPEYWAFKEVAGAIK